jgi:hypothetical protein
MAMYKISGGPSKHDLSVRFFTKVDGQRLPITFKISDFPKGQDEIEVVINRLTWEDGSGEGWCFEGYAPKHPFNLVHGYFSTRSREGWLVNEKIRTITFEEAVKIAISGDFYVKDTGSTELMHFLRTYTNRLSDFVCAVQEAYDYSPNDRRTPVMVLAKVIGQAFKPR